MRWVIVGRGPSIENMKPRDFDYANRPTSFIALNEAIVRLRELRPIYGDVYTMQKDGCEYHIGLDYEGNSMPPHDCDPASDVVPPLPGETLIVSRYESANCWASHPDRVVMEPEPWYMMSVEMATRFAIAQGAEHITYIGFDSYTRDDQRTWTRNGIVEYPDRGYRPGAVISAGLCARAGVEMRWVTP